MDNAPKGQNNNVLEPPFEFYKTGINKVVRGSSFLAFLNERRGGEAVAIIALLALCLVAREFIRSKNDGFDSFALVGSLITVAMIFIIGLLAMLRITKSKHAEDTQEKQSDKTQPGIGTKYTNENGNHPGRDRCTKPNCSN